MSELKDEVILKDLGDGNFCIVFLSGGVEVARSKPMSKAQAEQEYAAIKEN